MPLCYMHRNRISGSNGNISWCITRIVKLLSRKNTWMCTPINTVKQCHFPELKTLGVIPLKTIFDYFVEKKPLGI